jgi:hypothetical protein
VSGFVLASQVETAAGDPVLGPPPRPRSTVATVCVRGGPAKDKRPRLAFLNQVVTGISTRGWRGLDALLFPGGFFKSTVHVGQLSEPEREAVIPGDDFDEACSHACQTLDPRAPACCSSQESIPLRMPKDIGEINCAWPGT